MAHRIERHPVRRGRHAARRRPGALPLAALILAIAGGPGDAAAGLGPEDLLRSEYADAPEWWRVIGRPGTWPDAAAGDGYPWVLAGLARGAWDVGEPITGSRGMAFPAMAAARDPLAWFDSLEVVAAEGGAWRGFDATLARAVNVPARGGPRRTRAIFSILDGDYGLDESALAIERGDSTRMLRAGAISATRGPRGAADVSGRHMWGVAGAVTVGAHSFDAGYAQRGVGTALKGGETESLWGESSRFAWRYRRGDKHAGLSVGRGRESGESFQPGIDLDEASSRHAVRDEIALEAGATGVGRELGARLAWSGSHVRRDARPAFDRRAGALWVGTRLAQAAGEGTLDLGLGAGRHETFDGWEVAPSIAYRFAGGPYRGRVVLERMLTPVWTDLGPGIVPFLQRTWTAGCEIGVSSDRGAGADLGILFGSTHERAIVARPPLEEQWLRSGFAPDPGRYDFGLLTAGAAWRARTVSAGVLGFALARDRSAIQPAVDPAYAGRATIEFAFQPFQNDLDMRLGVIVEGVGPRESEAAAPRRLEGYVTFGLIGTFTLGDATLTVRARNLEDRVRPHTWIDSATGREAVGVGREFRFAFSWKLFD